MCLHAKSLQSCPTLCNPMNCNPSGSSVKRSSGHEYWSGLPCPPPGDLSGTGIKSVSFMPPALAGGFFTISATWKWFHHFNSCYYLFFDQLGLKCSAITTAYGTFKISIKKKSSCELEETAQMNKISHALITAESIWSVP